MRKFALLPLLMGLACFSLSEAQPRDLFAEFEAEAAVSSSEIPVSSSSAAVLSSSAESSSSVASSSSAVSSSSVTESSSSSEPLMSSAESSSSLTPEEDYARSVARANAERQEAMRRATMAAQAAAAARRDEIPEDSALAREDSIMRAQDSLVTLQEESLPPISSSSVEQSSSSERALSSSSSDVPVIPSSSSMSRRDLLGPVKVSKVNGIDEMKGKYKNPRKALFMSLVVPGSGQLYIGGSTFTNVRGVVYLALEAGLWGGWYYYSVYKYGKQVDRYKKFAKAHYSIGRYENAMRDLYDAGGKSFPENFETRYMGNRETFCEAIYGNAETHGCYTETLFSGDGNYKNDFVNNPVSLGEEMKKIDFKDAAEIYSLIATDSYVLGWDVVDSVASVTDLKLDETNASAVSLGSSKNKDTYRSMRNKANSYADMQAWFFGGLILNHIASAVDAALTANAHNKTLYQEDLSWYDHLHLDGGVAWMDGFGLSVMASWGF